MPYFQSTLLYSHVGLGSLAIIVGAIALIASKGKSTHIRYGKWFAVSMIGSSLIGAIMGIINYSNFLITGFAGVFSVTLIVSSLLTLKRKQKHSQLELMIASVNGVNILGLLTCFAIALQQESGRLFGFYAEDYLFLTLMATVMLIGDMQYMTTAFIEPHKRIARHLWRMCLGFFIAAGSAFSGPGATMFPHAIQESGLLFMPELFIFLFMMYWFIKFRFFHKPNPGKL